MPTSSKDWPTRYGFNFQWMTSWQEGRAPRPADEKALDFLAAQGFDFVRIPTDYRFWVKDFDYLHPDEAVFDQFESYLKACRARKIHMSLNLHRAPGYCINNVEVERDRLWKDKIAQDGFVYQWESLARRFKGISAADLSFDLLNEPPEIGRDGMTREAHEKIMRRVAAAIFAIDPDRPVAIDGLDGGNLAMPELADLPIAQSCRGYQPMPVSHYEASWWSGSKGLPPPVYPGCPWEGKLWNRDVLHDFYEPWIELEKKGVHVYVGEFGCYNHTPNDVALRWFNDLFSVLRELRWGYAMWNFEGAFGIVDHGRPNTRWEDVGGYRVDRDLLDLMIHSRAT